MLGAITGMIMKTMKISDMISAIARPPNTSRTIETAMTRVEAAPTPWMKRSASSVSKFGARLRQAPRRHRWQGQTATACAGRTGPKRAEGEQRKAEAAEIGA